MSISTNSSLTTKSFTNLSKTVEDFALATNFGAVLVDIKGKETSNLYNFSPFCQIMRSKPEYKALCQKCDAFGGLEAAKNGDPFIYRCHAGLTDISLPVIRDNKLSGFMLFGQVEMAHSNKDTFHRVHPIITHWQKDLELRKARDTIRNVSSEQVHSAATLLQTISNYHFSDEDPRDKIKFTFHPSEKKKKTAEPIGQQNSEIKKALAYIEKNLTTNITLDQVSDHVFLSQFYFSRLFKKEMGVSFTSYLNQRRIEQAKVLLTQSNLSVKIISKNMGYSQTSYFCKIFKEIVGMTPAKFRKEAC